MQDRLVAASGNGPPPNAPDWPAWLSSLTSTHTHTLSVPHSSAARADGLPVEASKVICDDDCTKALESKDLVTLPSGLSYKDIKVRCGAHTP